MLEIKCPVKECKNFRGWVDESDCLGCVLWSDCEFKIRHEFTRAERKWFVASVFLFIIALVVFL